MWVRKGETETRPPAKHYTFNPLKPLLVAILVTLALTFSRHYGWQGKFSWRIPESLGELLFSNFIGCFVLVFAITYSISIFSKGGFLSQDHSAICSECHKVQSDDSGPRCGVCGGGLEALSNWRWIRQETGV